MRGADEQPGSMFGYVSLEDRVPQDHPLCALLLQALYTICSERPLMEQLDYNLLFRWFVGLGMDDAVWSPTTFTKDRDRLLDEDVAAAFFDVVVLHADTERLLSDEHFTSTGRCSRPGRVTRASGHATRSRRRVPPRWRLRALRVFGPPWFVVDGRGEDIVNATS